MLENIVFYNRNEVIKITNPDPCFNGFDDFLFEYKRIPIGSFLKTIRSNWHPKDNFIVTAENYLKNTDSNIKDRIEKIIDLADSYKKMEDLLIPAFLHRDLKKLWPDAYPPDSGIPNSDIIIEDGNHRLTALAIRFLRKKDIFYKDIGIFIGRIVSADERIIVPHIKKLINENNVIPKPVSNNKYLVKGWGKRRNEIALIYKIPNLKKPNSPHEKGITESEWEAAYRQLINFGYLSKKWFDNNLINCSKEGSCNFTSIGGIFELLGLARYGGNGVYNKKVDYNI